MRFETSTDVDDRLPGRPRGMARRPAGAVLAIDPWWPWSTTRSPATTAPRSTSCLPTSTASADRDPGGERCKSQAQLDALLATFEACELPKHGVVLAIGGGTVSDVVGVAALLMRRSVPLVLLPTTLLAQVDAAVGGKNGINSPTTKNMIGHFHHPLVVASDPGLLRTLDARHGRRHRRVHQGLRGGRRRRLRRHLPTLTDQRRAELDDWAALVTDAQDAKLRLLIDDPFEASSQRLLNYGHAFAHLLEERSGFELLHGEAVLFGMLIENEVSQELGIATDAVDDLQQLIVDLVAARLPDPLAPVRGHRPDMEKVRQMRRAAMNLVCVARAR